MLFVFTMYLPMHTGVQHNFHITWCSSHLTVPRQVSLVPILP